MALVHHHLGTVYLATQEDTKAADEFKKASELASDDADLKPKIEAALKNRTDKGKG